MRAALPSVPAVALTLPLALALALGGAPALAGPSGKALFADHCSGCHQEGGVGQSGLAPPLVDRDLWTKLGPRSRDYIAGVLIGGFSGTITAGGERFIGLAMPPQDALDDRDLEAIAEYVLNDLNDIGVDMSADTFDAQRQTPPSHTALRALRKEALR